MTHIFKNATVQEAVHKNLELFRQAHGIYKELEELHANASRERYLSIYAEKLKAFNNARLGVVLAASAAKRALEQRAKDLKSARIAPSEDAQLLQLPLSADELALVIERNAGNDAFARAALQYAETNGLHSQSIKRAMQKHYETVADYDEVVNQTYLYLNSRIPNERDMMDPQRLALIENEFKIMTEAGGLIAKYDAML